MDLINYVASLPQVMITKLYENEFTCLAIFRSLTPLAKQYVTRLAFIDKSIPQGDAQALLKLPHSQPHRHRSSFTDFFAAFVTSWALPAATTKHEAAIEMLLGLHVLHSPGKAVEPAYALDKSFRSHLRVAITSGLAAKLDVVPIEVLQAAPSKEEDDEFAASQWEVSYKGLDPPNHCELHPDGQILEHYRFPVAGAPALLCWRWTMPYFSHSAAKRFFPGPGRAVGWGWACER